MFGKAPGSRPPAPGSRFSGREDPRVSKSPCEWTARPTSKRTWTVFGSSVGPPTRSSDLTSGTWEQVFGKGRPESFEVPVRVDSPPYKQADLDSFRQLRWPADEIFRSDLRHLGAGFREGKTREFRSPRASGQPALQASGPGQFSAAPLARRRDLQI